MPIDFGFGGIVARKVKISQKIRVKPIGIDSVSTQKIGSEWSKTLQDFLNPNTIGSKLSRNLKNYLASINLGFIRSDRVRNIIKFMGVLVLGLAEQIFKPNFGLFALFVLRQKFFGLSSETKRFDLLSLKIMDQSMA